MKSQPFDDIPSVLADLKKGKLVIVVDDADRENEGDLILAAEKATAQNIGFMVRHTSGVICVPMEGPDLDRLDLPLMTQQNMERMRTAYTISVDAAHGVTTGISAADRARTIRLLGDLKTKRDDLVRPGHIFPLRYRATPRRPSTSPDSQVSGRPACSRKSSTTTAPCRGSRVCGSSPGSTN